MMKVLAIFDMYYQFGPAGYITYPRFGESANVFSKETTLLRRNFSIKADIVYKIPLDIDTKLYPVAKWPR